MSEEIGQRHGAGLATSPAPRLRQARFEDYDGILNVGTRNTLKTESFDDWQHIWVHNPLWDRLGRIWPIGWVLESPEGEVVGSFMNVPSLYRFQGEKLICASSRAWAVLAQYRGYGLLLIDEYYGQTGADLCVSTSTGPNSLPVVERLATRIPLGDWETTSFWLVGHVGLARRKLRRLRIPFWPALAYPLGLCLSAKDSGYWRRLPQPLRYISVEDTQYFDDRFNTFWNELQRQNPNTLLAERSSEALSWHFGISLRHERLWILTASSNGQMRAYCVFAIRGRRDSRSVTLVDYQSLESDVDLLPSLLWTALRRCAKEEIHVLENLGRGIPKMRAIDVSAPYHKKLPSWRFFYRAADAELDVRLRSPQCWDPSVYDGDASIS